MDVDCKKLIDSSVKGDKTADLSLTHIRAKRLISPTMGKSRMTFKISPGFPPLPHK